MTLLERLNELDERQVVFIGSESAAFEVGYAGEIRRPEYLEMLNTDLKGRIATLIKNNQDDLKKMLVTPVTYDYDEEKTLEENASARIEGLRLRISKIEDVVKTIHRLEGKLDRFTPIEGREVKYTQPRISGDGMVINIAGEEHGDYWFIEEKYPDGMPEYGSDVW